MTATVRPVARTVGRSYAPPVPDDTSRERWRSIAPEVFAQFDVIEATARSVIAESITDPIVGMMETVLGVSPGGRSAPADDERARAGLAFAEQFVVDVSGIAAADRAAMAAAMGSEAFLFVQTVYVNDMFLRARFALGRLFDTPIGSRRASAVDAGQLWPELEAFMASVARLDALDPITTELIRLHGARAHRCRLCQSRLSVRAADRADDPTVFAGPTKPDDARCTQRQQIALRLTDALVTQPRGIDAALSRSVHDHFNDAEVVEIVLDVVRNAANKIAVALGADAPNVDEGIEFFDLDASGAVVASVDADVVRAATSR